jgi:hypothetical protein
MTQPTASATKARLHATVAATSTFMVGGAIMIGAADLEDIISFPFTRKLTSISNASHTALRYDP